MTDLAPGTTGQGTPDGAVASAPPVTPSPSPAVSAANTLGNPPVAHAVAPVAAPAWLSDADETTVGYVQNKGWTEPKQVLEGYRNLEKLLGADRAGNTVVLPKPDAPLEEREAFFNRLGRPAEPDGYKIDIPAEGGSPEFAKASAAKMHELGLTKAQGDTLAAWYNEQVGGVMEATKAQREQAFQRDQQALATEWGAAHSQNVVRAQVAARALGMDKETIDKIEGAIGYKATMQLFQKIGAKSGEPDFVSGRGNEGFNDALTPGQANAKLAELRADKAWVARYFNKDAAAVAEFTKLMAYANPEPK